MNETRYIKLKRRGRLKRLLHSPKLLWGLYKLHRIHCGRWDSLRVLPFHFWLFIR